MISWIWHDIIVVQGMGKKWYHITDIIVFVLKSYMISNMILSKHSTNFSPHVRTKYVLFSQSTYLVHTGMYCVYKNIAGDAVLCRLPVGNKTICAWHVCCGAPFLKQCPCWCPTYMTLFWYILSTYWYVQAFTVIPFLFQSVLGTYRYVVCTASEPVRTKYSIPLMRFTIPDVWYHSQTMIS